MRQTLRAAVLCVAWLGTGLIALAGESDPLKDIEGRLALQRAKALADKKLYERAQAALDGLAEAHPGLAKEAKDLATTIIARTKRPAEGPDAYRTAIEDSRKTGRPVMLFFGREACGNCRYTKSNLETPKLATYKRAFIQVFLNCDAKEDTPLMDRLRADKNMTTLPFIFYVSSSEELLDSTAGAQEAEELREKFRTILKKTGPVPELARVAQAAKTLKRANELMDKGKCGAAGSLYLSVAELKAEIPVVQEAKGCLEVISQLADGLLQEARTAIEEKKLAEAAPRLVLLQRDFAGSKAGRAASAEIEKLKADPDAKSALDAVAKAAGPPTGPDAEKPAEPTSPKPETPAAKPKPPAGDPKVAADRLLATARNFIANKAPEKAKPYLKRIVEQYPDTDAALEAGELLKRLE